MRHIIALLLVGLVGLPAPVSAFEERGLPIALGVEVRTPDELHDVGELAAGRPFTVRVPLAWGDNAATVVARTAAIRGAVASGYDVVVSLRLTPSPDPVVSADGFAAWVAARAGEFGSLAGIRFDVTNRPNALVPEADADVHPVALEALVSGVLAADAATEAPVSFSVLATGIRPYDLAWWNTLGTVGGEDFATSVDRVGVQLFPSTRTPIATHGPRIGPEQLARQELVALRTELMPLAGLGRDVPIEVTEFGFPMLEVEPVAFPGSVFEEWLLRTESNQARMMTAMLDGIGFVAETFGVEGAFWSRLSDPEGCTVHGCFGLLTHDGGVRASFHELRANQERTTT